MLDGLINLLMISEHIRAAAKNEAQGFFDLLSHSRAILVIEAVPTSTPRKAFAGSTVKDCTTSLKAFTWNSQLDRQHCC